MAAQAQAKKPRKTPTKKRKTAKKKPDADDKTRVRNLDGGCRVPVERLRFVEGMLALHYPMTEIVKAVEETFGISRPATVYEWRKLIYDDWHHEGALLKKSEHRSLFIQSLRQAFNVAKKTSNPTAMIKASVEIAKVCGVYEPLEIVITSVDADPVESMTSAQRRAHIRELEEEMAEIIAKASGVGYEVESSQIDA